MNPPTDTPITASLAYLVDCGYTAAEARNLVQAIYHSDPEKLWDIAPKWIEHVGQHKQYQTALLDVVAMGLISVTSDDTGEWLFSLTNDGRCLAARKDAP